MEACAVVSSNGFEQSEAHFGQVCEKLRSEAALEMSHSEVESLLEQHGRQLLRQLLQDHLDLRQQSQAVWPVRDGQGQKHGHVRARSRKLTTVFGAVEVTRNGYGGRQVETLYPLDGQLNLPVESHSYGLQRKVAMEVSRGSFDDAIGAVHEATGVAVAKRQAQTISHWAAEDFEEFYQQRRLQPESATTLQVISTDGKGIVMRQQDLRAQTRRAARQRCPDRRWAEPKTPSPTKAATRRMAQVATVYSVAPYVRTAEQIAGELGPRGQGHQGPARPRPTNKRVWASIVAEPADVIFEAFSEACRRDPKYRRQWVVLVDGAQWQLDCVRARAALYGQQGARVTIIVDLIHVLGYLWEAAHALHGHQSPEAKAWLQQRLAGILAGRSSYVAAGMRQSATRRGLGGSRRKAIDTCARYLLRYADYLRYDRYLAQGYPIATGVIEGACRHLIKDRMDITGARWRLHGAEAVLKLRALKASGDFDEYWAFHQRQELRRNHLAGYFNASLPAMSIPGARPRRRHLQLVPNPLAASS